MLLSQLRLGSFALLAQVTSALHLPSITDANIHQATRYNATLNKIIGCAPQDFGQRRPLAISCQQAISSLSTSRNVGRFHTGGEDDEFKLPVEKLVGARGLPGSCLIQIELKRDAVGDRSNWEAIVGAAEQLSQMCQSSAHGLFAHGLSYTGGVASTGDADNILIYIVRPENI